MACRNDWFVLLCNIDVGYSHYYIKIKQLLDGVGMGKQYFTTRDAIRHRRQYLTLMDIREIKSVCTDLRQTLRWVNIQTETRRWSVETGSSRPTKWRHNINHVIARSDSTWSIDTMCLSHLTSSVDACGLLLLTYTVHQIPFFSLAPILVKKSNHYEL